jgi:small-conductance mechanosensitive channel
VLLIILVTWYVIRLINTSLDAAFAAYAERRGEVTTNRVKPLISILNLIVWLVALVFLLDNLGFEISAIVAGLGIGGIAIALAAQALLGDLFSYFVIFFDRPFELGDFVIFEDVLGTIEHIGIKTTQIRSLGGEQITVANSILTNTKLRNYKRMIERRVVFSLGVTYDTKAEQIREIPTVIREIIEAEEQARFDRAHFQKYGDSSLVFEVVYYALTPDYTIYMDIQQRINLGIFEAFEERGIEFAFPTRTVHVVREPANDATAR